jgi:hypothetical protein
MSEREPRKFSKLYQSFPLSGSFDLVKDIINITEEIFKQSSDLPPEEAPPAESKKSKKKNS